MIRKLMIGMTAGLLISGITVMAHATLTTIGNAVYNGNDYHLIWDDDNNGKSVVWLDYTNASSKWDGQISWAAGLGSQLTYNIFDSYRVTWDGDWRLPSTVNGFYQQLGYDGTTPAGYNITNSEMGHLFYDELGNLGRYDSSGTEQIGYGLQNTGEFENLFASLYWSSTRYVLNVPWLFNTATGLQDTGFRQYDNRLGLALCSTQVFLAESGQQTAPVPIPSTLLLLGSGIIGIVAVARRKSR